jgi:mono/diheme cytochrome c family protein
MAGLSRAGILVVLAACGGGQRAGQSDSAAVAAGSAPMDTTAMAPSSVPHDSATTASTAAAPADTGAVSTSEASKPTGTAKSTAKPSATAKTPTAKTPASRSSATTPAAASSTTPAVSSTTPSAQDTSKKPATGQDTSKKAASAQDTTKKATTANASGGGNGTPQQIALGDSIFHGQVGGGTCSACHGQDAKGTAVAPDLTDSQWLNGDGSYQFLVNTITNGVPQPKQHPAPMPPKGGAPLTDDQVKAVAAYEYSLSHKS